MTAAHREHFTHYDTHHADKVLHVSSHKKKVPYSEKTPNAETLQSFRDAENNIGITSCYSVKELLESLSDDNK